MPPARSKSEYYYSVYFPRPDKPNTLWSELTNRPFLACVPQDAEDADILLDQLYKHPDVKHHFKEEKPVVLPCGIVSSEPRDTLYDHSMEWFRTYADAVDELNMQPCDDLKELFPSGPAAPEDYRVDMIIVTRSFMEKPEITKKQEAC